MTRKQEVLAAALMLWFALALPMTIGLGWRGFAIATAFFAWACFVTKALDWLIG